MAAHPSPVVDPDTGIPDLIRRLTTDSKRLAGNEVRLAKLELQESARNGARGSVWMGLALATGVVAAVALTVLLVAAIGALIGGNYWAGALITGALELLVGWLMLRHGLETLKEPSYSLEVSREALKDTAAWVRHPARR